MSKRLQGRHEQHEQRRHEQQHEHHQQEQQQQEQQQYGHIETLQITTQWNESSTDAYITVHHSAAAPPNIVENMNLQSTTATIATNNSNVVMIVLQGRGYIQRQQQIRTPQNKKPNQQHNNQITTSSSSNKRQRIIQHVQHDEKEVASSSFVEINGFVLLLPPATPVVDDVALRPSLDDDEENASIDDEGTLSHHNKDTNHNKYYFESLEWGSWITLTMSLNTCILISSIGNTTSNNNSNSSKPSFVIHYNNISNDDNYYCNDPTTTASSTTTISNNNVIIRPTIYPQSWKDTCSAIIQQDYHYHKNKYCKYQPNNDDNNFNDKDGHPPDGRYEEKDDKEQQQLEGPNHHHHAPLNYSFMNTMPFDDDDDDCSTDRNHSKNVHQNKNDDDDDKIINNDDDDESFQIIFCGSKSVGKSTLLKYILNQILSNDRFDYPTSNNTNTTDNSSNRDNVQLHQLKQQQYVVVLDADPGQPEFVLPGMIGLTIIKQPVLHPSHRNYILQQQEQQPSQIVLKSYFFGSVTSSTDPMKYIQCIQLLVDEYYNFLNNVHYTTEDDCDDMSSENNNDRTSDLAQRKQLLHDARKSVPPLLVNMDGWIKGFGYEILQTLLLDVLKPNHIVQIVAPSMSSSSWAPSLSSLFCNDNGEVVSPRRPKLHTCEAFHSILDNDNANKQGRGAYNNDSNDEKEQQLRRRNIDILPQNQNENNGNDIMNYDENISDENNESDNNAKSNDAPVDVDVNNNRFFDGTVGNQEYRNNSVTSSNAVQFQQQPFSPNRVVLPRGGGNGSCSRNGVMMLPQMPASIPASSFRGLRLLSYFSLLGLFEQQQQLESRIISQSYGNSSVDDSVNQSHDFDTTIAFNKTNNCVPSNTLDEWDPLSLTDGIASILVHAVPYVVPIDSIQIRFTSRCTSKYDIKTESALFAILNGSIVGLCCGNDDDDYVNDFVDINSDVGNYCNDQSQSNYSGRKRDTLNDDDSDLLLPCVGFGIIRSIDVRRRLLYILSPCAHNVLRSVNVLMISSSGDIALPTEECLCYGLYSSSFPYQTFVTNHNENPSSTAPTDHDDPVTPARDSNKRRKSFNNTVLGTWPMRSRNSIARR